MRGFANRNVPYESNGRGPRVGERRAAGADKRKPSKIGLDWRGNTSLWKKMSVSQLTNLSAWLLIKSS